MPILIPTMIITTEKENVSKQTPPNSPDASYSTTSLVTMTSTSASATFAKNNQTREADHSKTIVFCQIIKRFYYFYNAPVTKFVCNSVSFSLIGVVKLHLKNLQFRISAYERGVLREIMR